MKLQAALICDFINETKDGKINIIGSGVTGVNLSKTPSIESPVNASFFVFIRLERSPHEDENHKFKLLIQGPNGNKILNGEIEFKIIGKFHNLIAPLNFRISELGEHSIELFIDGENDVSLPFLVELQKH